jgi:hypothetical protein
VAFAFSILMKMDEIMNKKICVLALLPFIAMSAHANPDVISREYKLLLKTNEFHFNTEAADVNDFLDDAATVIEAAIGRDVTGSESLDTVRTVKYYDTAGSCTLDHLGYSFRERIQSGNSEVTLKFRDADRYISDFEDMSGSNSSADTKLEEDIGINAVSSFNAVYGHSTTESNTRTLNDFQDINVHFPGFDTNYGFSDSTALSVVGRSIDLGSIDADVSVTLWYSSAPAGAAVPIAVEVSFKYADGSADYTKQVVNRAKQSFLALQNLSSWVNLQSITKTKLIYTYNPTFCN